jgi:hypothetical protein
MTDVLGLVAAVLVLIAALFGLIPPLLAGPNKNNELQRSATDFLDGIKVVSVIIGILFIMFMMMSWPAVFQRVMAWGSDEGQEEVQVLGLDNRDRNLLILTTEIWSSTARNEALLRVIDHALDEENFPLAIAAAREVWSSSEKNEQLQRVLEAMIGEQGDDVQTEGASPEN